MNSVIREENWEFWIVTVPLRRKRLVESKNSFFDIFLETSSRETRRTIEKNAIE